MALITVITPVAPYHEDLANEAGESVKASTLEAEWLPVPDTEGKGPGWARNLGVMLCKTPYIFFLDADDILVSNALEKAVARHEGKGYTYGDWVRHDGEVQEMPDCYRWNTKSHVISVLMHRQTFVAIGGFDENIDFEDSEFFLRAMARNICGVHAPHPFIHYRTLGKRSIEAKEDPVRSNFLGRLRLEYKGMSCCGDSKPIGPANTQAPGDVLVQAQWGGNKITQSAVDGRNYPRTGNGKMLYVSAHDAALGYLVSGGGRVPIKATYAAPVEPDADFEDLKRRFREMAEKNA